MNNNQYTLQKTTTDPYVDKALKDFDTIFGLIMSVLIALAILWVWSMISMINLNTRFKEFLRVYEENNPGRKTANEESKMIIDSVDKTVDTQPKDTKSGPLVTKSTVILVGVIVVVGIVLIILAAYS